ncbi:MAG: AraC family transcriptional regulator [Lachnospiraceae bacterium]|nr:AraC family transcriptional regulator [Lachnospiraceae bacterium]
MIKNEVINEAISYIMEHITDEITVEDVAEHCHFSKFHFSRVFKEETGESVYAFIKRIKMEQSAFRLKVERQKSVTDICNDYGYTSSNYSSAFRQHHSMSPADFRKSIAEKSMATNPNWEIYSDMVADRVMSFEECNKNISIETLEDFYVIYERHKGNYHDLKADWCAFTEKYKEYMTEDTILLESTYDDPTITDVDGCLYDICMTVDRSCKLENTRIMEGGRYVVYHFDGYLWDIFPVHQTLLNVWFPKSGYALDKRYGFDIYHSVDSEDMHMVMDICIPIMH